MKNILITISPILIDLIIYGIIYLRVNKSRLLNNMIMNIEFSFIFSSTGLLLNCTGIFEYNDKLIYPNLISSIKSDSLVRHVLRSSSCVL